MDNVVTNYFETSGALYMDNMYPPQIPSLQDPNVNVTKPVDMYVNLLDINDDKT